MPYSSSEGKGFFEDWFFHMFCAGHLNSMLDIGAGSGEYGKIAKAALSKGQVYRSTGGFVRSAVEVWKPYIDKFNLFQVYDVVYQNNIIGMVDEMSPYDLIILGDVLEHLPKDLAIDLFFKLKLKAKFIWLSIPVRPFYPWQVGYDQDSSEWRDNPYEEHKYYWTYEEIIETFGPFLTTVQYPIVSVFLARGST